METATTERVDRKLVTGGDPNAPFKVPLILGDFRDAPELKKIGDALIGSCEELEDLKWAIEEDGFEIAYVWKKKASKSADRVKAGTLGKAAGLAKHFAAEAKGCPVGYVVALAADANYGQTAWQIEALVFHELYHCKIARKTKGKGEDKVTVPVLKTRSHDLEMFWAERQRYGDWRFDLKLGQIEFAQVRLPMGRPEKPKPFDPSIDLPAGVETEAGPVDGGAPDADWAGQSSPFADDPEPSEETRADDLAIRLDVIRAEYGTRVLDDGTEVCKRCGVAATDHPLDVCAGGLPPEGHVGRFGERRARGKAKTAAPVSDATNGLASLSGHLSASNGNHDRDDVAGHLLDPDRVMATLTKKGWSIGYEIAAGEKTGRYINMETAAEYDTEAIETSYRAAVSGRGGA